MKRFLRGTAAMAKSPILSTEKLGFLWKTKEPFLFCAHHFDDYPKGDGKFCPDAKLLAGRSIGNDFSGKDGWSMYHGDSVPGFPRHPHRGFETITLVRTGFIDHSDSLGAAARFGSGDCQWLTAGKGIEHAEMFPLLRTDAPNPGELFQIWLNLPAASKFVDPYFTMFWANKIPMVKFVDGAGRAVDVLTVVGALDGPGAKTPLKPPPSSWAADPSNGVALWWIYMEAAAEWSLPPAPVGAHRTLYFFEGSTATLGGERVQSGHAVEVEPSVGLKMVNGDKRAEFLMMQAKPIGEPVAKHGPFVMNTEQELKEAFQDYRKGKFGEWPWSDSGPVHAEAEVKPSPEHGRFARYPDGRMEKPSID